ncbi:MAG: phosphoribosylformylglycinamidine synthase II [Rhodobiaceae bacterium]|nr:phosphoribosylformylglycinamidine synthase II [Rhodobiaceae bacterium]
MIRNDIDITPELIAEHGLKPDEYQRILDLIGREPTFTELGIFSAMWNEHCSYKSSKKWLRTLPTKGPRVIQGPGENAGVVDIDDGDVIVFKMESHNHPSFISPYEGAATGVGGILRDVFTMGARPVAAMNALRFGAPENERTRHIVSGVVEGIGGYGNCFGVPTIGGEVNFDARYNANCLVNAFAAGLAKADGIFLSEAKGVGLPIVYLGSKTGRDGIHGATMASAEFDDDSEEKRPTVQIGDPFSEKLLLEACLELMASGAVIAIQDMGAAGLTCSAVEMGAKGNLGVRLDLDKVPCREDGMSAYEMMLSESQERMLMVLKPEMEAEASAIFRKWDLGFAVVGETTDDLRFRVFRHNDLMADLPIKELGDEAPEYDRPWVPSKPQTELKASDVPAPASLGDTLVAMLGLPDMCSRRWVWEQYDNLVQGNTLAGPGGDAAVIRVNDKGKGLAFSLDVTPRYCEADPVEGGKQAVAECWRNITAVGAEPLAATDNLNFGNPEKPEIMGQFVGCIQGIGEACLALDMPIVSGNVSLYNETNGQAILPTPAIGGVGLLPDVFTRAGKAIQTEGETLILIGARKGHLGQSIYVRDIVKKPAGTPPPVDLQVERRNGDFVRSLIRGGRVSAVHDISDGGLLVAVAEMTISGDIGATITPDPGLPLHAWAFGEDQACYVLSVPTGQVDSLISDADKANVPAKVIGKTGGRDLTVEGEAPISLERLSNAHEGWLPQFMAAPETH